MLETVIFRSLNPGVYPDLSIPVIDSSPDQSLFLRDITGIEPVTATINTKGYGVLDGEFYMGSRLPKRNIVMKFGFNTNGGSSSVAAGRSLLYGYMMSESTVWLRFVSDDHVTVDIVGYVESLTPTRFTDDPEMQVSIICPKPNFVTDRKTVQGQSGIAPAFVPIQYNGNRGAGIDFVLDMGDADYAGAVILETQLSEGVPYQTFLIYDDSWMSMDWQFRVNTEPGTKHVDAVLASNGALAQNMLTRMDPASWWISLVPGQNLFRVRTPNDDTPRAWTLTYAEQYGGI